MEVKSEVNGGSFKTAHEDNISSTAKQRNDTTNNSTTAINNNNNRLNHKQRTAAALTCMHPPLSALRTFW